MSKIITKVNAYTTRDGKACLVQVAIDSFDEIKGKNGFNAIVTDTAVKYIETEVVDPDNPEETILIDVLTVVEKLVSRAVFYSYEMIDGLFVAIGDPIEIGESFSSQLSILQGRAMLIVTQGEPIYGTTAQDWEILV